MTYKSALIGCGRISFKHIEAFAANREKANLVAVCDIRETKAQQKAAEFANATGIRPKVYTSHAELLKIEKPGFVTIATESGNHAEITIEALKAGCHVLVEKPMALSTADASRMIATAKECNRKLGVCFQNRFNIPVQRARQALEQGRFGRIHNVTAQIRWNRGPDYYAEAPWRGTWAQDGGCLMNQCTHAIDLLQWFLGSDVKRVHGVTRRFMRSIEAEDFGAAIVEFGGGALGIIEGSVDIYPKNLNETISIFGEKGTVVIGGLAMNKIETWRFADAETVGDTEDKVVEPSLKDPPTVYGFGHPAIMADFLDAIAQNREPLVSGLGGRVALDIILGIYKSMKTSLPVDFPHEFNTTEMRGTFQR